MNINMKKIVQLPPQISYIMQVNRKILRQICNNHRIKMIISHSH